MTVDESRKLQKGTRVYWRGDAADSGIITETSWDAVTIAWNNGEVARVHYGDMREIRKTPTTPHTGYGQPNQSPCPAQPRPAFCCRRRLCKSVVQPTYVRGSFLRWLPSKYTKKGISF